jgi:Ca-activated chloride channel homolog
MAWPDLAALHFLRPWWLLALLAAVAMAILAARALRSSSRWESLIDTDLRDVLLERGNGRPRRLLPALIGLGLALASLGLAGPTWQRLPQPVQQRTDALVIVLDLSLSMYAEDIPPSRLVAARHAITDVLRARREGFTGLIAYAGDAHTVTPLTDDVATIENLLAALSPEMMPQLGSNPGAALELARRLFSNAGVPQGRILLVTDGIDRIGDVTAFADRNFPISVLGVGTPAGGPIPLDFVDQAGRFLTDRQGNTISAKLDVERLANVAQLCFGRYATAAPGGTNFTPLLTTSLPSTDAERRIERRFDLWADYGYWLALATVPFALLYFRRGAVALLVCALLPPPAHADWWQDLWLRPDQQALHALEHGDPERAAGLFRNEQWRGVAQYRNGDYAAAGRDFSSEPSAQARYNLGNALARQGKLPDAIAAYDATLQLNPHDADAAFNKSLLEKLLQQKQQQSSDKDNQERQQNRNQTQSKQSRQQNSSSNDETQQSQSQSAQARASEREKSGEQRRGGKPQPQSEQQRNAQTAQRDEPRDEQRDALEQWLRRVPDDPAGLLRRKFQYETNMRRRDGEAAAADPDHIF